MAGRITVFGAQAMLTSFFSKAAEPPPTFWLALILNNVPTPYLSGAELDEPELMGYQRVGLDNNLDNWANTSQPYVVTNTNDFAFAAATADWGSVRYWALCNSQYDGYVYMVGEMEQPIYVTSGDVVVIPEGSLNVSLGPFFTITDN